MALTEKTNEALTGSQEAFEQMLQDRLRQAVRVALTTILQR